MADETTTETVTDVQDAQPATPDGDAGNQDDPQAELTRMREALKKANAEAKRYRLDAESREKAKTEAEQAALAEQGKYKELFEKQQAELAKAQAEAREASLKILRRDAAAKVGLPPALADRLQGETEPELEADAKAILDALPKPTAPNINSSPGAGGAPRPGQPSDAEIAEKAARYNVRPELLKQSYAQ